MSQLFQHITVFRMKVVRAKFSPPNLSSWFRDRREVESSLWGEEELLWQVKEVKYLRVLFMSAEKVEREIDRQSGVQSPVVQKSYWSDAVHRRLGQEAKPSIYQSIYGQWWLVTKKRGFWIHVAAMALGWGAQSGSSVSPLRGANLISIALFHLLHTDFIL